MGTVMTRATSYLAALSTICEPSRPFENRVGLGPEIRQFYCPRPGSPQQSTATDQASLLLPPIPGIGLQAGLLPIKPNGARERWLYHPLPAWITLHCIFRVASYNTVLHPTRDSNVINVNGDHLTFHCARDIIIQHYHTAAGLSMSSDRDRANAGATGAAAGYESGESARAAQHEDVAQAPDSLWRRFLRMFGL
ncbi:hypothetical protein FIBSPDRAFT_1055086 [Athelia psychrophila]|uniref:Uncharacterized protein n=1 Tax=Athelia psychrophila TaxID=1759441 RepID=A0A167UBR4_9AGAM|nr:hypothetical protein FIBSPDRAFT_1055086 [Fibularhizoctonia sp. CBS 109695]